MDSEWCGLTVQLPEKPTSLVFFKKHCLLPLPFFTPNSWSWRLCLQGQGALGIVVLRTMFNNVWNCPVDCTWRCCLVFGKIDSQDRKVEEGGSDRKDFAASHPHPSCARGIFVSHGASIIHGYCSNWACHSVDNSAFVDNAWVALPTQNKLQMTLPAMACKFPTPLPPHCSFMGFLIRTGTVKIRFRTVRNSAKFLCFPNPFQMHFCHPVFQCFMADKGRGNCWKHLYK